MKGDDYQDSGKVGELVAADYLIAKGYEILEKNYRNKWGEIDIVADKNKKYYFCEVKTVVCEDEKEVFTKRPEERVTFSKVKKLQRIVRTYLFDSVGTEEVPFDFFVIAVALVPRVKKAFIWIIRDVL